MDGRANGPALAALAAEVTGSRVEVAGPGGWGPWVDGGARAGAGEVARRRVLADPHGELTALRTAAPSCPEPLLTALTGAVRDSGVLGRRGPQGDPGGGFADRIERALPAPARRRWRRPRSWCARRWPSWQPYGRREDISRTRSPHAPDQLPFVTMPGGRQDPAGIGPEGIP